MDAKDSKLNAAMLQLQGLLKRQDQLAATLKDTAAKVEGKKAEIAKILASTTAE